MFIKALAEKHDGKFPVSLIGADEATATKHFEQSPGVFVEIPLTKEELNTRFSALCRMNYTNKDGVTYYSSDAETKTTVLRSAASHVLCMHTGVKWGKAGNKRVNRVAIWEIAGNAPKNPGIPTRHYEESEWKIISALVRQ
jgi:hypothetical protein